MPASEIFPETRWTLFRRYTTSKDEKELRDILNELCTIYYQPIFKCFLNRGCSNEEAQDLTQTLFTKVVAKDLFAAVRQSRGRARAFLGRLAYRCWVDWLRNKTAGKRWNGVESAGEDEVNRIASEEKDFRMSLDRNWAIQLMNSAFAALKRHHLNKSGLFNECWRVIGLDDMQGSDRNTGSSREGNAHERYRDVAERLGMTERAFIQAVHRLRKEFVARFRDEVAKTLGTLEDVSDETTHLFRCLGSELA